jgi:hypothetical protein
MAALLEEEPLPRRSGIICIDEDDERMPLSDLSRVSCGGACWEADTPACSFWMRRRRRNSECFCWRCTKVVSNSGKLILAGRVGCSACIQESAKHGRLTK